METISTVTTAWSIAKTAGEISKRLYEFGKTLKDRDLKQQVDEILEQVRELKRSASELEDQNRELRERPRFKNDEYEFLSPFWYAKGNRVIPYCPRCFAKQVAAPMGEQGQGCSPDHRACLVCGNFVKVGNSLDYYEAPTINTNPFGR